MCVCVYEDMFVHGRVCCVLVRVCLLSNLHISLRYDRDVAESNPPPKRPFY